MRKIKKRTFNLTGIVISILLSAIELYGQLKDPHTGLFLLIGLFVTIFLYFLISWPVEYIKRKFELINLNYKDIEMIM